MWKENNNIIKARCEIKAGSQSITKKKKNTLFTFQGTIKGFLVKE